MPKGLKRDRLHADSADNEEEEEEEPLNESIGSMPMKKKNDEFERREEELVQDDDCTETTKTACSFMRRRLKNRSAPCRLIRCKQSNDKEEEDRDSITGRSTDTTEALRITGVPTLHKRVDL